MDVAKKVETFVTLYKKEKLSHIYLIETNDMNNALNDILLVVKKINCPEDYCIECKKCNLCNLIDQKFLPSLIIIEPDGKLIKKEQVIELKKRFSFKAIYSKNNIYIIKEADKLNAASANTILKFIEEPNENTYGFLLTSNINNVLPTIKSRCELVSLFYSNDVSNINEEYIKIAKEYISKIELENSQKIMYNRSVILDHYEDREDIIKIFQAMLSIYTDAYSGNKILVINKLDKLQIQKRIKLIIKFLEDINSNANIELLLDKYVIELSDEND